MPDLDLLFEKLATSSFRQKFHLRQAERVYLERKGMDVILSHAVDFVQQRLSPAEPKNDGKQTPFRHHPVFVAQHATATCCRGCLERWHNIPKGQALSLEEQGYILAVLRRWLETEAAMAR